jgi:hypothetical protein
LLAKTPITVYIDFFVAIFTSSLSWYILKRKTVEAIPIINPIGPRTNRRITPETDPRITDISEAPPIFPAIAPEAKSVTVTIKPNITNEATIIALGLAYPVCHQYTKTVSEDSIPLGTNGKNEPIVNKTSMDIAIIRESSIIYSNRHPLV